MNSMTKKKEFTNIWKYEKSQSNYIEESQYLDTPLMPPESELQTSCLYIKTRKTKKTQNFNEISSDKNTITKYENTDTILKWWKEKQCIYKKWTKTINQ